MVERDGIGTTIRALSNICNEKAARIALGRSKKHEETFEHLAEKPPAYHAWMALDEALEDLAVDHHKVITCVAPKPRQRKTLKV
jgi:hypothetical protein